MPSNIQICFVYCSPVEEDSARFATLPVKRMAQLCTHQPLSFHVVYSGYLNTKILQDVGVITHNIAPPRSDNPISKASWLFRAARNVVRNHEIDVLSNVWAHYEMTPVALASDPADVALRVVGEPITDPTTATGLTNIKRRIGRQLERVSVSMSDVVYFNSHTLKSRFDERLSLPSKAPVISQGVDTEQFAPKRGNKVAHNEPTFLFAGRLDSRRKGIKRTLKAFARFRDQHSEGQLVLAGRGDLPPDIRETVRNIDGVNVVGYLSHEELVVWYRKATALVLLSESEALPNVVLEAMASGLPVIATPVGDVPKLLSGNRGCLVGADGVEPVVSDMERLAEDAELRAELGSNARAYVEQEHSFDAVGEAFIGLFKQRAN